MRWGDIKLPPHVAEPLQRAWTQEEAFHYCAKLVHRHYENFPVGSWIIPRPMQPAVHSLYAFMRTADDFADEARTAGDEAERLGYLATWERLLADCERGEARHPVFVALWATLSRYPLPVQWLRDLLTAFKMDVTVRRYPTYGDLLNYCRYSANPVGRLILALFGYRTEEIYRLSDLICTGLQLANHWQDVAIDLAKDRIYLPQEDLQRFGVILRPSSPADVSGGSRVVAKAAGPPIGALGGDEFKKFQSLMTFQVGRTRELFQAGKSLPERVRGRLRWELRLTWEGGSSILDKIESARYDVFRRRPTVTKTDWLWLTLKAIISDFGF